ncbi:hypothetical protein SeMB42_g03032 [Synchytrium endobioticum]|uniref:Uncharacterized protein n=1 Tax=Synchytrium endobioticum TaxID=286115 RepID=A0A507DBS9_9FUNG|nr:hypothetical protein SeMB42_g03032 [Synchytrium endobioticum]
MTEPIRQGPGVALASVSCTATTTNADTITIRLVGLELFGEWLAQLWAARGSRFSLLCATSAALIVMTRDMLRRKVTEHISATTPTMSFNLSLALQQRVLKFVKSCVVQ